MKNKMPWLKKNCSMAYFPTIFTIILLFMACS